MSFFIRATRIVVNSFLQPPLSYITKLYPSQYPPFPMLAEHNTPPFSATAPSKEEPNLSMTLVNLQSRALWYRRQALPPAPPPLGPTPRGGISRAELYRVLQGALDVARDDWEEGTRDETV